MRVSISGPDSLGVDAQVVALTVSNGGRPAGALGERVAPMLEADGFRADGGKAVLLHLPPDAGPERVAVTGLGETVDADAFRTAAGAVARLVASIGGRLVWVLDDSMPLPTAEQARAVVDGLVLGGYDPGRWKSNGREIELDEVVFVGGDDGILEVVERTLVVARWANRARDFSNEPPNELTPERLAAHAEEIAGDSGGRVVADSFGPERMAELGMGSFGAVAQGSHNPARTIVLRYGPEVAGNGVVLGLVGKAVTFDSGGISIKPALYMEDMKGDMAGGAAVLAGMGAIAELGLPISVVAVVGATENMVGGGSFRPGDILRAANGKTIEVVDTDAEGRLILADVLWYAREQGATHLVDFATLTGAMARALGDLYAGVFGNDDEWRDQVVAAGNRAGDHAWALPLHRRYRLYTESAFADLKNKSVRGQGIPVYAAEFLREFAGDGPWAHIDMAGTGFLTWPRDDYLMQKGGTGYGVRLIAELARSLT
ncbi:MAG: leucyl aminopeptidase [Actinobacteria bacterium]|nr:leucyl aminopeptidase [Actinomycetota bacterium]